MITKVNTVYSTQYQNVTVTIVVDGMTDKPIQCFRMKGEGADIVKEGDTITVTGILKNYNGTIEFDANCTLDEYMVKTLNDEEKAAYELDKLSLPATVKADTVITLPKVGETYTDVVFTWTTSNPALASISNDKLTLTVGTEEKEVIVTVEAECGETCIERDIHITLKPNTAGEKTDTLNHNNTIGTTLSEGGNVTTYKSYTVTGTSGAEYAMQTAGDKSSIQIRSNNSNSGIVVTVSVGTVQSVTITFVADTADARTVEVYGRNTAYTDPTELYGSNKGTLLGKIAKSDPQTLTVTGDYQFIGLRSTSGAIYIESIEIVWAE